jgi:hypothetical protein
MSDDLTDAQTSCLAEGVEALFPYKLPTRVRSCFALLDIQFIGDLAQKNEMDLLRTRGFGRKSLKQVRDSLARLDLSLGMRIANWPEILHRRYGHRIVRMVMLNGVMVPATDPAQEARPIAALVDFAAAQRSVESQVEKLVARIAAIDLERTELMSEREAICAALQAAGRPLGEELLRVQHAAVALGAVYPHLKRDPK